MVITVVLAALALGAWVAGLPGFVTALAALAAVGWSLVFYFRRTNRPA